MKLHWFYIADDINGWLLHHCPVLTVEMWVDVPGGWCGYSFGLN